MRFCWKQKKYINLFLLTAFGCPSLAVSAANPLAILGKALGDILASKQQASQPAPQQPSENVPNAYPQQPVYNGMNTGPNSGGAAAVPGWGNYAQPAQPNSQASSPPQQTPLPNLPHTSYIHFTALDQNAQNLYVEIVKAVQDKNSTKETIMNLLQQSPVGPRILHVLNNYGQNLLHYAANAANAGVFMFLAEQLVPVNGMHSRDSQGSTPLDVACYGNRADILEAWITLSQRTPMPDQDIMKVLDRLIHNLDNNIQQREDFIYQLYDRCAELIRSAPAKGPKALEVVRVILDLLNKKFPDMLQTLLQMNTDNRPALIALAFHQQKASFVQYMMGLQKQQISDDILQTALHDWYNALQEQDPSRLVSNDQPVLPDELFELFSIFLKNASPQLRIDEQNVLHLLVRYGSDEQFKKGFALLPNNKSLQAELISHDAGAGHTPFADALLNLRSMEKITTLLPIYITLKDAPWSAFIQQLANHPENCAILDTVLSALAPKDAEKYIMERNAEKQNAFMIAESSGGVDVYHCLEKYAIPVYRLWDWIGSDKNTTAIQQLLQRIQGKKNTSLLKQEKSLMSEVLSSTDQNGNTLVHLAATTGAIKNMQALWRAGADVFHKNAQGKTPLYILSEHLWNRVSDDAKQTGVKNIIDNLLSFKKSSKSQSFVDEEGNDPYMQELAKILTQTNANGDTFMRLAAKGGATQNLLSLFKLVSLVDGASVFPEDLEKILFQHLPSLISDDAKEQKVHAILDMIKKAIRIRNSEEDDDFVQEQYQGVLEEADEDLPQPLLLTAAQSGAIHNVKHLISAGVALDADDATEIHLLFKKLNTKNKGKIKRAERIMVQDLLNALRLRFGDDLEPYLELTDKNDQTLQSYLDTWKIKVPEA